MKKEENNLKNAVDTSCSKWEKRGMQITAKQKYLLCAETNMDPRTVERVYQGEVTKGASRERVAEAAKRLKIPQPPKVSDGASEGGAK